MEDEEDSSLEFRVNRPNYLGYVFRETAVIASGLCLIVLDTVLGAGITLACETYRKITRQSGDFSILYQNN